MSEAVPPPLGPASVVRAAREQLSAEVGDEVVILNLGDEVYYGLDGAGALVWGLMAEPRRVEELRDAVVSAFEVEADEAQRDLLALLDELAERGLVEVLPSGA